MLLFSPKSNSHTKTQKNICRGAQVRSDVLIRSRWLNFVPFRREVHELLVNDIGDQKKGKTPLCKEDSFAACKACLGGTISDLLHLLEDDDRKAWVKIFIKRNRPVTHNVADILSARDSFKGYHGSTNGRSGIRPRRIRWHFVNANSHTQSGNASSSIPRDTRQSKRIVLLQ